uniref:Calpain-8 n=1 Tax=Lygus hesperus TaxID=30085 RepID=A0A0A9Y2J4_LYGHE
MASASKIDLDKEREDLVKQNALLDDIHFDRPTRFADPSLDCCEVSWLRPHIMTKDPDVYAFDTTKETRIVIYQSDPAFDWFMIPLANICLYPNLVYNILSATEDFSKKYGGMFKIRFHDSGKWIEIAIDDRLPHHSCKPPEWPLYLVSNRSGYWLPLIIKAYAKLHGSYEKLVNGTMYDAYGEFSSGVTETFKLDELPPRFHISMKKYYDSACLMNAKYVYTNDGVEYLSHWAIVEVQTKSHEVSKSKPTDVTVKLQHLFATPDGKSITDYVRCSKLLKLLMKLNSRDNDTEAYWMSFNDFIHTFNTLHVCTLDWGIAVFVRQPVVKLNSYKFNGAWFNMSSISHSLYDPGSIPFWSFPQYKFELREPDTYRNDKRCEFLVALQQPGHLYSPSIALIGFFIYRLVKENETLPVGPKFFKMYRPVTHTIEHGRLILNRLKLAIGTYLIIPVAEPENHNDFFLTVITEAKYDVPPPTGGVLYPFGNE